MSNQDPNNSSDLPSYGSVTPPPGDYPPAAPGGYDLPPQNNGKATAALVLGLVGLLCCGLFAGIPALILGLSAKKEIEASGGRQSGGGMATAGIVLGAIAIVWSIIYGILIATGVLDLSYDFNFEAS